MCLAHCTTSFLQFISFSHMVGLFDIEPNLTVLQTVVRPLHYNPWWRMMELNHPSHLPATDLQSVPLSLRYNSPYKIKNPPINRWVTEQNVLSPIIIIAFKKFFIFIHHIYLYYLIKKKSNYIFKYFYV